MADRDQEIQNMKDKKNNVEDDVFASFCEQIGVTNIRQYEERELRWVELFLPHDLDFFPSYSEIETPRLKRKKNKEKRILHNLLLFRKL